MTEPQTTTMQELARRWVHEHDEAALAEYCQREAARLDAEERMPEPSTAPTVFVPDMDAVDDATRHATNRFDIVCKAYVELERQMAEAGYVVVREDTALRDRAERLRECLVDSGYCNHGDDNRGLFGLQPGDLADDLTPRTE